MDAITEVPMPVNEPVHDYAPSSPERARLVAALDELDDDPIDLPHVIGGTHRMGGGERIDVVQPHRHSAKLGTFTNAEHSDATVSPLRSRSPRPPSPRAGWRWSNRGALLARSLVVRRRACRDVSPNP
jgi:1-pyrroline-5-carboxylate dehydrogenase